LVSIIIHILPQEIDQLEQTLIALKKCSVKTNKEYLVEVALNCNLTNWKKSILPQYFFVNKLCELENLTKSWAKTNFHTNVDNEILGCTDPRRNCTQYDTEATIWLDVDIVFSDTILGHLELAIDSMEKDYYVITPETTRLWDNTWDVITNEKALKEDANHENYFNRDPYTSTGLKGEVHLKPINTFKWAGGWFTCISSKLVEKVKIPKEMGPYYQDDTFLMVCYNELTRLGLLDVSQYVMVNEVIIENNLFRFNPYDGYLNTIDKREEFKKIANDNFKPCVEKTIKEFIKT
jgi:hypothetical protein